MSSQTTCPRWSLYPPGRSEHSKQPGNPSANSAGPASTSGSSLDTATPSEVPCASNSALSAQVAKPRLPEQAHGNLQQQPGPGSTPSLLDMTEIRSAPVAEQPHQRLPGSEVTSQDGAPPDKSKGAATRQPLQDLGHSQQLSQLGPNPGPGPSAGPKPQHGRAKHAVFGRGPTAASSDHSMRVRTGFAGQQTAGHRNEEEDGRSAATSMGVQASQKAPEPLPQHSASAFPSPTQPSINGRTLSTPADNVAVAPVPWSAANAMPARVQQEAGASNNGAAHLQGLLERSMPRAPSSKHPHAQFPEPPQASVPGPAQGFRPEPSKRSNSMAASVAGMASRERAFIGPHTGPDEHRNCRSMPDISLAGGNAAFLPTSVPGTAGMQQAHQPVAQHQVPSTAHQSQPTGYSRQGANDTLPLPTGSQAAAPFSGTAAALDPSASSSSLSLEARPGSHSASQAAALSEATGVSRRLLQDGVPSDAPSAPALPSKDLRLRVGRRSVQSAQASHSSSPAGSVLEHPLHAEHGLSPEEQLFAGLSNYLQPGPGSLASAGGLARPCPNAGMLAPPQHGPVSASQVHVLSAVQFNFKSWCHAVLAMGIVTGILDGQ